MRTDSTPSWSHLECSLQEGALPPPEAFHGDEPADRTVAELLLNAFPFDPPAALSILRALGHTHLTRLGELAAGELERVLFEVEHGWLLRQPEAQPAPR